MAGAYHIFDIETTNKQSIDGIIKIALLNVYV